MVERLVHLRVKVLGGLDPTRKYQLIFLLCIHGRETHGVFGVQTDPKVRVTLVFIDREARQIIRLAASVCPSVRPSVCLLVGTLLLEPYAEWSIYGLGVPRAKQKHHDI